MSIFERQTYLTPGVYREEVFLQPIPELLTGVPVFLGFIKKRHFDLISDGFRLGKLSIPGLWLVRKKGEGDNDLAGTSDTSPWSFTLRSEFEEGFGALKPYGYLVHAVRGFFENGGSQCFVQVICVDDQSVAMAGALVEGLKTFNALNTIDLVCTPDIMWPYGPGNRQPDPAEVGRMQVEILKHCEELGDRFAILDSLPGVDEDGVLQQRLGLKGINGALYYPWIKVLNGPESASGFVPPCGHIAGIYARSDQRIGVHKAPANEVLEGVVDLEVSVDSNRQGRLNPAGINCLRAFPGRGIRVWGARTLSGDPVWIYVNVRRLFLTLGRWIECNMADVVFEPNDSSLWARIKLELTSYLNGFFEQGALKGNTPDAAFYVKCDDETNPNEVRDAGMVVTEIGLAPSVPGEFIIIRIIQSDSGISVTSSKKPVDVVPPVSKPPGQVSNETGVVRISHIEYSTPGSDVSGEHVLIQNQGTDTIDMSNWTLTDKASHVFRFPWFTLNHGALVRVWTKTGINTATDLYWGSGIAIWNNIGDTATLCDRVGNMVNSYKYLPHEKAT